MMKKEHSILKRAVTEFIRFWNHQVMNDIEAVIRAIIFAVESDT